MGQIFLVDDDRSFLEIMEMVLEDTGYEVLCFEHGISLLRKLTTTTPDLILLDYRLPQKNGAEITKIIRQRFKRKIPVIIISADLNVADKALGSGANFFLAKPIDIDTLLTTINRYV